MTKPGAYLIFGPSGSGKSNVAHALKERGLMAIDTDRDTKLAAWINLVTGHRLNSRPGFPLTQSWLDDHKWRWDTKEFQKLLRPAATGPLFFCGDADNIKTFFPYFRLRFALTINNDTMTSRLKKRDPKRWNDHNPELSNILKWNDTFNGLYKNDHVTTINADQPANQIVDDILGHIAQ